MKEKRARWLADRIDHETGGKVRVALKKCRADDSSTLYHVLAFNPELQRELVVHNEDDWQSVKEAWGIAA